MPPVSKMRFTLVRHGETIQNAQGIVQGQLPGKLSGRGKSQVRKTARELASTEFKHIYSSDLNRCKQTTEILIKHHENTPVTYDKRLREISFGEWEGLIGKDLPWDQRKGGLLHAQAPGGETMDEHKDRAVDFINEKLNQHDKDDNVLVVSHGGTLRLLVAVYYHIPYPNVWAINLPNAQAVFLDIDKPLTYKLEVL